MPNKKRIDHKRKKYQEKNRNRFLEYRIDMHDTRLRAIENLSKGKVLGFKNQIISAYKQSRKNRRCI